MGATDTGDNASPGGLVTVDTDKATGRAVITLDAAAVNALVDILDDLLCSGRYVDPGPHGLSDDAARAQGAVASAICQPLLKLLGY